MSAKEKFIDYVKNGSQEPFVSIQIGAGAGFDVKLAGKKWNSEGTLDDTIKAYEIVECEPLFNIGLPGLADIADDLNFDTQKETKGEERFTETHLESPHGTLHWKFHELPKVGTMIMKYPITIEDDANAFNLIKWFAEQHHKNRHRIAEKLEPAVNKLSAHGPVSVQWNLQPFELFGLPSVDNLVMLAKIFPDEYRKTCEFIRDINLDILTEVFKTETDFVFLGGPGSEMLSPDLYERHLIPDSQVISDYVHKSGKLIYSHICSPIQPFLDMGFYNKMGFDLFETLSPPPVGNVDDLVKAREIIDENICTRGNIGLDILLEGNEEDVEKETIRVLEATKGTKHMIAASDYLFYDIPLENVKTIVKTAKQYGK